MPAARRAVTVSIVTQSCIHAENRIREQATHCANFAQIIGIDPLVIAVPYFLYAPCLNKLLDILVVYFLLFQFLSAHHAAVVVEYFFAVLDIHERVSVSTF